MITETCVKLSAQPVSKRNASHRCVSGRAVLYEPIRARRRRSLSSENTACRSNLWTEFQQVEDLGAGGGGLKVLGYMATGRLTITTLSFHINAHVHCVIVIVIVMAPISTSVMDDINDKSFDCYVKDDKHTYILVRHR